GCCMKSRTILLLSCATALLLSVGCLKGPDGESGGDEIRPKATELKLEKWVPGEVSWKKGDRTDWFVVNVKADGLLKIEINVDRTDKSIDVVLTDTYGRRIKKVNSKRDGKFHRFPLQAEKGQKYYVMIRCATTKDSSEYSIRATVKEETKDPKILRPE
ncbi:MAG: hypothetical protein KC609_24220, partial [Myxococcales bacterium]|nr:hypothetical protein [Myxococcales bacterium]